MIKKFPARFAGRFGDFVDKICGKNYVSGESAFRDIDTLAAHCADLKLQYIRSND